VVTVPGRKGIKARFYLSPVCLVFFFFWGGGEVVAARGSFSCSSRSHINLPPASPFGNYCMINDKPLPPFRDMIFFTCFCPCLFFFPFYASFRVTGYCKLLAFITPIILTHGRGNSGQRVRRTMHQKSGGKASALARVSLTPPVGCPPCGAKLLVKYLSLEFSCKQLPPSLPLFLP